MRLATVEWMNERFIHHFSVADVVKVNPVFFNTLMERAGSEVGSDELVQIIIEALFLRQDSGIRAVDIEKIIDCMVCYAEDAEEAKSAFRSMEGKHTPIDKNAARR